jgi:hypothetical protein
MSDYRFSSVAQYEQHIDSKIKKKSYIIYSQIQMQSDSKLSQ